jgi:hypothetical protein
MKEADTLNINFTSLIKPYLSKKGTLLWVATDKQLADILTKGLILEEHGLLAEQIQGLRWPSR